MEFNEKLENYAEIILKKGINIQENEKIEIRSSIDDAEFARILMKKAFDLGAENVYIKWIDFYSDKIKLKKAPSRIFESMP